MSDNIEEMSVDALKQQDTLAAQRIERLKQDIQDLVILRGSVQREIRKKQKITSAHSIAG